MLAQVEPIGGWLERREILVLHRLAKSLPDQSRILEMGSYRGRSTSAIGYGIQRTSKELYCIDIWRDFEVRGIRQRDQTSHALPPTDFGIFEDFLKRTEPFAPQIRILRGATEQFAEVFPHRFFDLIFIDAAHDYKNVCHDLKMAQRCLKPGGIICGHDYQSAGGQDVIRAVNDLVFSSPEFVEHGVFPETFVWYARKATATFDIPNRFKVSAIVSTYKSERFMRGCLEDLEAQTIADQLEIIVVDSNSPQNERAIVEEFQQRYNNIIYIRTAAREGVYTAWNRGIQAARGEYITNSNTDDRHRRDAFERMAAALDARPDIALAYANVYITEIENETFDNHTRVGTYCWLDFDPMKLIYACFMGPQPMWRKSMHTQYDYFDESFESAGDWEFWLRMAGEETFFHIDEFLGLYLKSPTSIEHRNRELSEREGRRVHERYVHRVAHLKATHANEQISKSANEQISKSAPLDTCIIAPSPPPVVVAVDGQIGDSRLTTHDSPLTIHDSPLTTHQTAAQYNAEAKQLYEAGNIEEAERHFKRAIRTDASFVETYNNLAVLYWQRGEIGVALYNLTQALRTQPDNLDAVVNYGLICREIDRVDMAQQTFQIYLQRNPDVAEVRELLAELEMRN